MGQLLLNISSATVRVVLRAYFTIVLLLLGIFGQKCCGKRVQLRIIAGRQFNLTHMTGWLSWADTALVAWSQKCIPAGWLGYVMILSALIWTVSDLAVSGLVVTVSIVTRCPFNTTGIYTVTQSQIHSGLTTAQVSPFGPVYRMINQARLTSMNNGGLGGIYKKVNGDNHFRADPRDIWGQWRCQDMKEDTTYRGNITDIHPTFTSLQSSGLIFTENSYACYQVFPNNTIGTPVIWSVSEPDVSARPWNFRAAIDSTLDPTVDQLYKIYECKMDAPSLLGILAQTSTSWSRSAWCNELRENLYPPSGTIATVAADPGAVIEAILDAVVVQGATNWSITSITEIGDPTQGCLAPRTEVRPAVMLLLALATFCTVGMGLYWAALSTYFYRATKLWSPQLVREIEKSTPNDLLGWMMQAVRETDSSLVEEKDLKEWHFGYILGNQRLGLKRD
ncbi:hypothetical protein BKA56DRAFT_618475 [Ilyonectria sp. MPI-CAGE-AT-0026]|nr:hypothetical protein BKA56DRAFT_618475 [Ilyonectria sp. MPI-CAGE-AT-0026]